MPLGKHEIRATVRFICAKKSRNPGKWVMQKPTTQGHYCIDPEQCGLLRYFNRARAMFEMFSCTVASFLVAVTVSCANASVRPEKQLGKWPHNISNDAFLNLEFSETVDRKF